jgi:predicted nucleotidyltransferase
MFQLDLQSIDPRLPDVLARLPPASVKIFGSALADAGSCGDIDIAVAEEDTSTLAYLLHHAPILSLHPVALPRHIFDNLHNLLSWKNCLVTTDGAGIFTYGNQYVDSDVLVFNPASRTAFPDFKSARRAAKKLELGGRQTPMSERSRAVLHLCNNLDQLAEIAREALTDEVVWRIAGHGAVVAGGFFRDEVDGRCPKDIDVFVPAGRRWSELCDNIAQVLEEIDFDKPAGSRVNLRKFRAKSRCPGHEALVVDVIDYGFVHSAAHVVETFDFSCNTLWWDPASRTGIQGGFALSAPEVVWHIRQRKLVVGNNLWYRASPGRALMRWQRFRRDGYVADAENAAKYSFYVKKLMMRR